jgi:predicted restriction endonuclease
VQHGKALLEYLPVIPEAPDYKVCKYILDYLCDLLKELEIGHIFAHTDEQVYAKLAHIIWKYPKDYQNVIILIGGFHQLRFCSVSFTNDMRAKDISHGGLMLAP